MQGHTPELLSAEQMQAVDRRAAESGVDTYTLMQAAGRAVANQVLAKAPRAPVITILVGTGNNGGDGYICLLYTSPSPRDATLSRMPSSA